MKISNWHTSGRTNKTKDVESTFYSVNHVGAFSLYAVRLGIRTIEPQKVTTVGKHKEEIKFCDIVLTMPEAANLLEKLQNAINRAVEWEEKMKQPQA